ncbi:MAG: ATP-grasp domain-containing protein [Gammaproteobacteria bacterium]
MLIIGRSGNLLARAAKSAGYEALVIDSYGDADTRRSALDFHYLYYNGARIDARQLLAALADFATRYGPVPLCWTSGWEASGHILFALAKNYPIKGSAPQSLLRLANPRWFNPLHENVFGEVGFSSPSLPGLIKGRTRSGGHSVKWSAGEQFLAADEFFHAFESGRSVSVVCVATGRNDAVIIGWNEHYSLQPSETFPFRYSGATKIEQPIDQELLKKTLGQIANLLGLRGIFGCDLVLTGDSTFTIVDVNPRPTSTAPLHLPLTKIIEMQFNPAQTLAELSKIGFERGAAHAVVYADVPIMVPKKINWPAWVSDIPSRTGLHCNGEPVCSIWAQTPKIKDAKKLLSNRLEELLAMLND